MNLRSLIVPVLMLILLVPALSVADDAGASPKYIATYFLTNVRCPSCLTIERLSSETVRTEFSDQIESRQLEWRTVNIDEGGNYHFVKDYGLYTKSVIISEEINGKEVRWKNLPKVWELLGNEGKFRKYLKEEISAFMAAK
jgi:hypothetical protein